MSTPPPNAPAQSNADKLAELLCNFLELVPDTVGVVVSESGKITHTQTQLDPALKGKYKPGTVVDKKTVEGITKFIEPLLDKIQHQFVTQSFGTAVLESDLYRLLNIAVRPWVFTFALDQMASLDEIYPYAYFVSEKIVRVLEGGRIQLTIPKLGNLLGHQLKPPVENDPNLWNFKYILVGNSGAGKTSLVSQFVEGKFKTDFRPTIGLNVMTHSHHFHGYDFRLNIYDIGSQKLFQRVRRTYYIGSNAALIVFDLSDRSSFDAVETWKQEMDKFLGKQIPFCIVGNKCDLDRKATFEEGTQLAAKLGGAYIETSALNAKNVEDAFALLAYKIISDRK